MKTELFCPNPIWKTITFCLLILLYFDFLSAQYGHPDSAGHTSQIALDTTISNAINQGKWLYNKHCLSCHGKKGKGDGPRAADLDISSGDFTSFEFKERSTGSIIAGVNHGKNEMPSFVNKLSDEELMLVVEYIKTFYATSGGKQVNKTINHKTEHKKKFKYFLSGDLFTGIRYNAGNKAGEKFNTAMTGIAPILIWKISDRLMYEGELVVLFSGNDGFKAEESAEVSIEYSNLGFILNDQMILRAGTFFSATGVFEDWHQQFITNKMTSRPLGIGRAGNDASTDLGVNLRGLAPIRNSRLNYSLFITNGEMLNMDESSEKAGHAVESKNIKYDRFDKSDFNKAVSARIGLLPFGNSMLEFGLSSQLATGHDESSIYEKSKTIFTGTDLTFIRDIDHIKGTVYLWSAYYYLVAHQEDLRKTENVYFPKLYEEKSDSRAWFAQLSYRPTETLNRIVRRCELAVRYSEVSFPGLHDFREDKSQYAIALDYWIHWNSVLKFSYEQEFIHSRFVPGRFISTVAFVF